MEIINGRDDTSTRSEHNHELEYIKNLQAELDEVLHRKTLTLSKIESFLEQINAKESEKENIKRSLAESRKIATEIEAQAQIKADAIMAEAEAMINPFRQQMALVESEIAAIEEELNNESPMTINLDEPGKSPGYAVLGGADLEVSGAPTEDIPAPIVKYATMEEPDLVNQEPGFHVKKLSRTVPSDSAFYNMHLIAFVNARHYVTFGGKDGPIHAHSWQAQIEVGVPAEKGEVMGFAKISSAITAALEPYENTVLNYVHPFNIIQPTTENIAMYFFNRLEDALTALGLGLEMTTLWETPTRGIQVTNRNTIFDGLIKKEEDQQTAEEIAAMAEQADAADKDFKERISRMFDMVKVKRPLRVSTDWEQGPLRPPYPWRSYFIALGLIALVTLAVYHSLLFAQYDQRFPWGSDTWGHLFKADYLYHEILQGNYYPQFTEYWYNGIQPFRYWAPLPYYVLALMEAICKDIFIAGNLYIVLCAAFGGFSWLLLSRWMGIWPATMAGVVWVMWQDNVRVSLSEGNVPRILATALLPLLLVMFFKTLGKKKTYRDIIITALLIHTVVLSHAMIGAVYCVGLCLFAFFLWIFGGCRPKDFGLGIGLIIFSITTTAWWLLPSLTGGITGLDVDAVKEAVQFIPAMISLDPFYRLSSPETFYLGISMLVALAITFVSWKSKPALAKSFAFCGLILIVITFPIIKPIYTNIPLSHLMWPLRFTTFGILAILIAGLTFNTEERRHTRFKSSYITGISTIVIFLAMLIDSWVSVGLLVHTSTNHYDVLQSAQVVKTKPAWRVATIDLSELGSAPSYIFSESAGLEQVFGWAWQGAVTSRNIMLLNTGLETQYYPFLFRSSVDMGATDLVVKDDVVKDQEAFWNAAEQAGYKYQESIKGLSLWHSVDQPYLVVKKADCLVIGRYAGTIALQFPGVEMGLNNEIDQYSLEYLKKYSKIILSGAKWSSKAKAERLITDYLDNGGTVIVELSGMPENVLAKQPEFLNVYGEPVTLHGQFVIKGKDKSYELEPLPVEIKAWKAYVPMGLDQVDMYFDYYGNQAPVYGYKLINGKKVWYLGANLAYQSFMTGDPVCLQVLKETLGMDTGYPTPRLIPLHNYQASENGYTMAYQVDQDIEAIVPVSAIDGLQVMVDGTAIPIQKFENLLQLKLPAGSHKIEIKLGKTPVYRWGKLLSLLAGLALIAFAFYSTKRFEVKS